MSRVVGIVQARMGSTRLPGKVLADIAGKPMLGRVIERLGHAGSVDEVVIATTPNDRDRPIAEMAARCGCRCYKGDEEDVLARYLRAAEESDADIIVRVTSDCPLIDPAQVDETVSLYFHENADYAANGCIAYLLPRGSEVEVFAAAALRGIEPQATKRYERVHVTPYFYRHPEKFRIAFLEAQGPYRRPDLRVCVDTQEDLDLVRAVYERLDRGSNDFSILDVIKLLDSKPRLKALNAHIHQKKLQEG
ncbi:MAG: glycosyltransferase family protein [Candidatus Hydrogenedentota bacterium]